MRNRIGRCLARIAVGLLVCCGMAAMAQGLAKQPESRIFIAGDLTAQSYTMERYPMSGWGQYLACGLKPGVVVENRAIGGRSTRTFLGEGRWERLRNDLAPGDTVLIQFGHNDAAVNKPERYADPNTTYRTALQQFVSEARTAGAYPVLITPVAQRMFNADGTVSANFAAWSAVMREVASQTKAPLIDLEVSSRRLVKRWGAERSKMLYLHFGPGIWPGYPAGLVDDTHFSEIGARQMANLIAQDLSKLPVPAAAAILRKRPQLILTKPLGRRECR